MTLKTILTSLALAFLGAGAAAAQTMTMYKTPWCGCCEAWAVRMEEAGFTVERIEREDLAPIKAEMNVPGDLAGCHTAEVSGYVVEGHVPAEDIRRLLDQRPDALGLAVPGMPVGSPGMEMGGRRDPYQTILFSADDRTVFARR